MFVALGIEEHDATVIEVEGGACAFVVLDSMPSFPITPDVLNDDDRPLVAMRVELFKLFVLLNINAS
jgi:hypothetical protein